jgi:phosphoglycolate phosphatase-like HAD superfamily hydrolase
VRYRLAILDLEGTLVPEADDVVAAALAELGASCGLAISADEVRRRAGMNGAEIVRACLEVSLGRPASPGVVLHLEAELRRAMRDRAENYSGLRAAAGVSDLLTSLGVMGVAVGVVSGLDRRSVDALLDRFGWGVSVHHSICADDVTEGRPSEAMIRAVMAKAGVRDAATVASLGDSPNDLTAGLDAGCGMVACPASTRHLARVESLAGVRMINAIADLAMAMGEAGAETESPPQPSGRANR